MKKIVLILILTIGIVSHSFGQDDGISQELRQLTPLVSTKEYVENLLGKPTETFSNIADYKTAKGDYTIHYSEGRCGQSVSTSKYDIERDILVKVRFYPEKRLRVSHYLKKILKGFSESITDDVSPKASYFANEYKGLAYGIFDNQIISIEISPKKSLWHLGCDIVNKPN